MSKPNPTNKSKDKEKYKAYSNDRPTTLERLLEYLEVQTWLKTVSEETGKQYLRILGKFCEFSGKTPKQLILERDKELKNPDPNSRTGIRDLVLDFRRYLEKEGYAQKRLTHGMEQLEVSLLAC